jgi:predicted metal-binding membrane protein
VATPLPSGRAAWPIELLARHERAVLGTALITIPLLCGAWIVPMARDMYGAMTGPSLWMMTSAWDARHVALLCAMWTVMMIGMMVPSAAPMLLIYAAVMRRSGEGASAALRVYPMAAGYLLIWFGFSVAATFLQRALSVSRLLSPMMALTSPRASGLLLIAAAAYQLTPLKGACLDSCRSPIAFIAAHTKPGATGAFRLGVEHGLYCLGCCWALMLILFVGGVMNLLAIAALMMFVLFEKLTPFGVLGARLGAVGLLAAGMWILAFGLDRWF